MATGPAAQPSPGKATDGSAPIASPAKKETSFLFRSGALLWQAAALMLVPSLIALLVVIPLSQITKSAGIDAELLANHASFKLMSGLRGGREVTLLSSMKVKTVWLNIDAITIPAGVLTDERSGKVVTRDAVEFRFPKDGLITLSDDDGIVVQQIRLEGESAVDLVKEGQNFDIAITPSDRVRGQIVLGAHTKVYATNCELFDESGNPMAGLEPHLQQRFILNRKPGTVIVDSAKGVVFGMELAHPQDQFSGGISQFMQVSNLAFPLRADVDSAPVRSASVAFWGLDREPFSTKSVFVQVPGDDPLDVVSLSGKNGGLDIGVSGFVHSLKIGKSTGSEQEQLPNLLNWIYHDQKLGIIFGILVWVSGTVLASVKLADDLKKVTD